ncbi:MAG: hypothetical protein RLZZ488_725 [Pseudomonadota bacterium]
MNLWCPTGALFHTVHLLCVSNQYAIGPFPPEMQKACENFRGTAAEECAGTNWDIYFAGVLRGNLRCPAGSSLDAKLNACTDGSFAYGPFTGDQVDECRRLNWAYVCETMRWPLAVLRGENAPPAAPPKINADGPKIDLGNIRGLSGKLLAYYSNPANYKSVHAQVMKWFGTTQNACVAFMSTALRNVGLQVPRALNSQGYNISTWTAAFSDYLQHSLGWRRIDRLAELRAGDVVFTLDLDGSRRVPAHVFLFAGWKDSQSTLARVIDNQGFLHTRDLLGTQGNFTPFQYALRPND